MKDTILYGTVAILLLLVFAVYTAEAAQSEVTLRPGSINSFQCSSVTGKINIKAGTPGEFDILIEGVPSSWLEYPESVRVDDEKTVNYIINPQKPGTYYLSVMVDGPRGYFFGFGSFLRIARAAASTFLLIFARTWKMHSWCSTSFHLSTSDSL